jgi:hypothetical protein
MALKNLTDRLRGQPLAWLNFTWAAPPNESLVSSSGFVSSTRYEDLHWFGERILGAFIKIPRRLGGPGATAYINS